MKKKVLNSELQVGMYVCELDRPWLDTPFLFQGFHIDTPEQIQELRNHCDYVYIDPMISAEFSALPRLMPRPLSVFEQDKEQSIGSLQNSRLLSVDPKKRGGVFQTSAMAVYADKSTVEEELIIAKEVHHKCEELIRNLTHDIHGGHVIDSNSVNAGIAELVASVMRNQDAMLLLTKLKRKDSYSFGHSIDVSIYMVAFGRCLGFPQTQLQILGVGGLLLDIGKILLPDGLLEKKGTLKPEENAALKRHVQFGMQLVQDAKSFPAEVLDIVENHHERQNGSGYPKGLRKNQIGMFANMAAIVDCFQALTSVRPYATPVPPSEALQRLYDWKGRFFHGALVEQFIQCVGIYPVGSLVELNTGEVGIVISQNRVRRLQPKVLLILDSFKKAYSYPVTLDLVNRPKTVDDIPYEIMRTLEYGMYGVDPREYYL